MMNSVKRYSVFCKRGLTLGFAASVIFVGNFVYLAALGDGAGKGFVYVFFFLHGLAGSLFTSAFWPCIKFIVFRDLTTTAYGLSYSVMNAMEFGGCALVGVIIDRTAHVSGGYLWSTVFLLSASVLAALLGLVILVWDYKGKKVLYLGIADVDSN